jgi:hypothetical protein
LNNNNKLKDANATTSGTGNPSALIFGNAVVPDGSNIASQTANSVALALTTGECVESDDDVVMNKPTAVPDHDKRDRKLTLVE